MPNGFAEHGDSPSLTQVKALRGRRSGDGVGVDSCPRCDTALSNACEPGARMLTLHRSCEHRDVPLPRATGR